MYITQPEHVLKIHNTRNTVQQITFFMGSDGLFRQFFVDQRIPDGIF